jgi:hypothetical protein
MYDREPFEAILTRVVGWQGAAQQMPLPELSAAVAAWQDELAETLNAFNDLIVNHADCDGSADLIELALGAIARLSTAMAIFTLGINQRQYLTAQQN